MGWNESRKVRPLPPLKRNEEDDKFMMMRQVNRVQQQTGGEVDRQASMLKRKEKREQELKRREEIKLMEKEDYIYTIEGEIRLKQYENRLLMQEEENLMRRHLVFQKQVEEAKLEKKRRFAEKERREEMLKLREREQAERKAQQELEAREKAEQRAERMKQLKLRAEARAKAAEEAKKQKQQDAEREKHRIEEEEHSAALERETMGLEEEYERFRMKREEEERIIRERIEQEEAKWKAWEDEEDAKEAEETRKRRERMAIQYAADRETRRQMNGLKRDQKRMSNAVPTMSPKKSMARMTSFIAPPQQGHSLKKSILAVVASSGFAPTKNIRELADTLGKSISAMSKAQLKSEQRRCAGLKRKTKIEIKKWIDDGKEPVKSDLYDRVAAIDIRLEQVKQRLETPDEPDSKPVNVSLGEPVASLKFNKLQSEQRRCVGLKRKANMAIKAWCDEFKQQSNGQEPMDSDKSLAGHLYNELEQIDQRISELKTRIATGPDDAVSVESMSHDQLVQEQENCRTMLAETEQSLVDLQTEGDPDGSMAQKIEQKQAEINNQMISVTNQMGKYENVPFGCVIFVNPGSPASEAGLIENDYICKFGDLLIDNSHDPISRIGEIIPQHQGLETPLCVQRWHQEQYTAMDLVIKLPESFDELGMQLELCNVELIGTNVADELAAFMIVNAVTETSPASSAGMKENDLIVRVGDITAKIENSVESATQLIKSSMDQSIPFSLQRWDDTLEAYRLITLHISPSVWDQENPESLLGCDLSPWDDGTAPEAVDNKATPIVVIDGVEDNSPAAEAGLLDGDFILTFGPVNEIQDGKLDPIVQVVESNVGGKIDILLQRWDEWEYTTHELKLEPKAWAGDGKLGCGIITYEQYRSQDSFDSVCKECMTTESFPTAAHAAAYNGHYDCIDYMSQQFDVFCTDGSGRTPLFYACYANQFQIVQLLLSLGPESIDEPDDCGDTALHAATSTNSLDCI